MDYTFDFYFGSNSNTSSRSSPQYFNYADTQFIYDDHRHYSKLYVLCKSFGLFLYIATLTRCDHPELYIIMNGIMCLSIANSARYEYRHFQRYGTTFSSIAEFETWKAGLWPKSRMFFSIIEIGVKMGYLIKTYPPVFMTSTICDVGESIFKIHIIVLFGLYIIVGVCSACLLSTTICDCICSILCCCRPHSHSRRHPSPIMFHPSQLLIRLPEHTSSPVLLNTNQECCICMDNERIQSWVGLPCGHMFHASCIYQWIVTHHTCPVCRFDTRGSDAV